MPANKRFSLLIILVFLLIAGLSVVLVRGVSVETNILKLMPETTASSLSETVDEFSESQTGEMVFLLTHENEDTLADAAAKFESALQESELFHSIQGAIDDEAQKEWYTTYFPYRYSFISPTIMKILDHPKASKKLYRHLQRQLYSIVPDYYGAALEQDPFQLFPTFMQSLFANGTAELHNNYALIPSDDDGFGTVITATVNGSPFTPAVQESVGNFLMYCKKESSANNVQLYSTGIIRFAAAAFKEAKFEITFIGMVSLIGVLIILLLTFRSLKLVFIGSLPIFVGIVSGFTVTAAFFPSIHMIALTMGASLTGIAIDYSLHYLTHLRFSPAKHETVLHQVLPGITLGAVTTLIGYGVLGFGGFPGFQQIALFTGAGLVGSYVTVVLGFPQLLQHNETKPLPFSGAMKQVGRFRTALFVLPFILVVVIVAGAFRIRTNDDIFSLRTPMPELDAEEQKIRAFSSGIEGSRFVVVTGRNDEELIVNLNTASSTLDSLVDNGSLEGYFSLSQFIPDRKEDREYRQKLQSALSADSGWLKRHMIDLGFSETTVNGIDTALNDTSFLSLKQWFESPVSAPWQRLYIPQGDSVAAICMLQTVKDETAMESADYGSNGFYLNKVAEVSRTLGTYRHEATILTAVAYLVILVLLMFRYGPVRGTIIFIPPVLSGAAALMLPGLFGGSITFMHIMALLLVLGIGIDYTIFFAEGGKHQKETLLAVTLSALSTILAFGVLGLSSTPALKAIGMVITPGILFSLLLAPVTVIFKSKQSS